MTSSSISLWSARISRAPGAVGGLKRCEIHLGEISNGYFEEILFVVDHQNGAAQLRVERPGRILWNGLREVAWEGQVERYGGSMFQFAIDTHGATGLLDKAVDHRETEASAFVTRLGGEERFKDALHGLARHALPGVGYGNAHVIARFQVTGENGRMGLIEILSMGSNEDGAAPGHCIARINHQIEQRALKSGRINEDRRDGLIDAGGDLDVRTKAMAGQPRSCSGSNLQATPWMASTLRCLRTRAGAW